MNVLISGSSGTIGSALHAYLKNQGHDTARLIRTPPSPNSNDVYWNADEQAIDCEKLEGFDAVIHLAGRNIAASRWTDKAKREIRDSRVHGTKLLSESLTALNYPPRVLLSASATGYYGDRGDERLTESSSQGTGFLAEVAKDWEEATSAARDKGIRTINLRLGVVLDPKGGALQKMLLPFRLGLGGILGNGHQYWSWITTDDVLGIISYCMEAENLEGPVNCVSPEPVTNCEFTKTLADVLSRPAFLPAPAFALRLAMGEMADALLLSSTRVYPERLVEGGYRFQYPELEDALRHVLE